MLVCICNGISDKDIKNAIHEGATGFSDIRASMKVGSGCGQCVAFAKALVDETISTLQSTRANHLAYELRC
jgi:bacterioferritin-associated ferredoxin